MALADNPPDVKVSPSKCSVGIMLKTMPANDRKTAEKWLASDLYSAPALLESFNKEGYTCAKNAIPHHRRRRCSCYGSK